MGTEDEDGDVSVTPVGADGWDPPGRERGRKKRGGGAGLAALGLRGLACVRGCWAGPVWASSAGSPIFFDKSVFSFSKQKTSTSFV